MDTKEIVFTEDVVIDDRTMELAKELSEILCRSLEDVIDELSEISVCKGRSLEATVKKHHYFHTEGYKKMPKMELSPSLAAIAGICKVPDNYDWRAAAHEERNKKYQES